MGSGYFNIYAKGKILLGANLILILNGGEFDTIRKDFSEGLNYSLDPKKGEIEIESEINRNMK